MGGHKSLIGNDSGHEQERFARGFAQTGQKQAFDDADLARIVESWPALPDAIRQAVLKLIS
jgi:hypothetical protein